MHSTSCTLGLEKLASKEFPNSQLLRDKFIDIINTRHFIGPLDEKETQDELNNYAHHTHSTLLFLCQDGFYIVYP